MTRDVTNEKERDGTADRRFYLLVFLLFMAHLMPRLAQELMAGMAFVVLVVHDILAVYEAMTAPASGAAAALLPCPFCGGDDIKIRPGHRQITFIQCGLCHAVVSFGGRERIEDTLRAWQHRVPLEQKQE